MAETLTPGLERRLRAELSGDVRFDRFARGRYATDASHYQIVPLGVVVPKSVEGRSAPSPSRARKKSPCSLAAAARRRPGRRSTSRSSSIARST
jgi:hypothetical protein